LTRDPRRVYLSRVVGEGVSRKTRSTSSLRSSRRRIPVPEPTARETAAARVQRALLSCSDKTGLVELGRALRELGVELLASGNTARVLRESGLEVVEVSDYTGFPEMMGGRLKTLHPKVHGGILARRDQPGDREAMDEHGIRPIDLVVVNLYPFEATVARKEVTREEAVEQIDIGGPTMVRAAAKNQSAVTVVVDPADYAELLESLRAGQGSVPGELRRRLARKAFLHTARYDAAIAAYLTEADTTEEGPALPEALAIAAERVQKLRYGENPHQSAGLYGGFLEVARPFHGKELSYNNILDVDAALRLVLDFLDDPPTVGILKHNTPCGVGTADDLVTAWTGAFAGDPDSPFGGIVIANRPFDEALAAEVDSIFTEVLLAPAFEPAALERLQKKKARRLLTFDPEALRRFALSPIVRTVTGGFVCQSPDFTVEDVAAGQVSTRRKPTEEELRAMAFGWKVVKHIRSNAIVFARPGATLSVSGGGTSRVDPVHAAVAKAQRVGMDLRGSALASEAFFPFPDGVEAAAAAGATAVVQPGGSLRDEDVVAAADRLGLAMVFTGVRHFRH
jgi:phosphoribosylaminoimidazolecarboxamide formyltransferase/IMP cyclohydrolase